MYYFTEPIFLYQFVQTGILNSMDKFLPSIKQKYKDRLINREKQWPPCHSNELVRLELVERKKGAGYCDNIQRGSDDKTVKRTFLAYGDLFKVESGKTPVRKILVEGDAGIGKTTVSMLISEDWSCEKLFQEFELVLLLPLRYKKVASAGSLPELLKLLHSSADVCKSVASYLEEEEAKKVLVIADGWDELSESEQQEGSFLYELLFETFPLMSVVVTSRPSASAPLHRLPCIDRFVEINGFGKDDIKEYIHCEFSSEHEKACRLLEQLEDNPLVESVCSVPLNCAILCHLWRTSEEALPSTMTQLYTKIILNVILRNIRKKDSFKSVKSLLNFDSLPKELQQSFWLMCEFAFNALKENRIVFSQEELAEIFPQGLTLGEKILCFGLLQSAETVLEMGHGVSFHFLHLTFMEYLAALHLSRQPQKTLLKVFSPNNASLLEESGYKYDGTFYTSHFDIVWRFYFGISFSGRSKMDQKYISIKTLEYVAETGFNSKLSLCHCAFESQNVPFTHKAIQFINKGGSILTSVFGLLQTAHDFAALLYVIDNLEEHSGMILNISHCGVRKKQIRRLTDALASKRGKLKIERLILSGNLLTGECLSDLFTRASAAFKPDGDMITIGLTSSFRNGLSSLDLSDISLRVCEVQALENVAQYKVFSNLKHLNLKGCLTGDADTNNTLLTTIIKTLLINCPNLYELDLSSNNLGVPGASAVAKGVARFPRCLIPSFNFYNGFILYLNDNNLGDEGLKAFFDNVHSTNNFIQLKLGGNSIHAAGVSYLTHPSFWSSMIFMSENPFGELDLSDNPLGLEGAISVGRLLGSKHFRFKTITLCRCKLTTVENSVSNTDSVNLSSNSISSGLDIIDIGQQLCRMSQNRTIDNLDLSGNNFTGEGIHILFGIMHQCVCLNKLDCTNCGINSDDLVLLLDNISQLKTSSPDVCSLLYSWDLSDNKVDDRGALALIDHLPSIFHCENPFFIGPCLNGNPIGSKIRKKLTDGVRHVKVSNYNLF